MALRLILTLTSVAIAMVAIPTGEAQGGLIEDYYPNGGISLGTVHCSYRIPDDPLKAPVFPNATVELLCYDNVVTTATTNELGAYTMYWLQTPSNQSFAEYVVKNCVVVVATLLNDCNSNLPPVRLGSPLTLVKNVTKCSFSMFTFNSAGFVPMIN